MLLNHYFALQYPEFPVQFFIQHPAFTGNCRKSETIIVATVSGGVDGVGGALVN
jgi:hypothetical protein